MRHCDGVLGPSDGPVPIDSMRHCGEHAVTSGVVVGHEIGRAHV